MKTSPAGPRRLPRLDGLNTTSLWYTAETGHLVATGVSSKEHGEREIV